MQEQTHQTHINVFVQDFEEAYTKAQAALSDLKAKGDALRAQFMPTIEPQEQPAQQVEKPVKKTK